MSNADRRSPWRIAGVAGVVAVALIGRLAWKASRPPAIAAPSIALLRPPTQAVAPAVAPSTPATRPVVEAAALAASSNTSAAPKHAGVPKAKRVPPPVTSAAAPAPIVPLDVARSALDAVGADPDAEAVWFAAINDPALSAHDRSDLIEDLNENGFADPDHVTPGELPLVLARLDLIEQLAPDAMDDVNAAAFAEAYKDLSIIADRLTR